MINRKNKKPLSQLTYSDLARHNKALGNPIRHEVLYWVYEQLKRLNGNHPVSVRTIPVTDREIMCARLLDNALSKEFALPDPDIYHYK